jgi:hypothetical protein
MPMTATPSAQTNTIPPNDTIQTAARLANVPLRRTLILMACGGRKADTRGQAVPLVELYEGPMWSTLRKHLGGAEELAQLGAHVMVLSGGLGFVPALTLAKPYEARLQSAAADALIAGGITAADASGLTPLQRVSPPGRGSNGLPWLAVIAAGGSDYRRVFLSWIGELRQRGVITAEAPALTTSGGIGVQRSQLGQWLRILARSAS